MCRYWMVGDVMLTTGIRDGVNLLPMEYCVTKNERPGVLFIRCAAISPILPFPPPPLPRLARLLSPCSEVSLVVCHPCG